MKMKREREQKKRKKRRNEKKREEERRRRGEIPPNSGLTYRQNRVFMLFLREIDTFSTTRLKEGDLNEK